VVDGEKPGVASRDEGKHAGRNDLLFVEKMMYMDEQVWSWLRGRSDVDPRSRLEFPSQCHSDLAALSASVKKVAHIDSRA